MPRLACVQNLWNEQVIQYLVVLQNSQYLGVEEKRLADFLKPGEARRYLYTLIVRNQERQSAFSNINELSSKNEMSPSPFHNSKSPPIDFSISPAPSLSHILSRRSPFVGLEQQDGVPNALLNRTAKHEVKYSSDSLLHETA